MARPAGGTVHVGKAAALIVVALILGVLVLRSDGGGVSVSAGSDLPDINTNTTLPELVDTTTTTVTERHTPSSVKVVAINATGTAGQAGKATTKLQAAGYNALQPGDATAAVKNSKPASVIYVVTAGYELDGREIAALFGLPDSAVRTSLPNPSPSADIKPDANIVVLVGKDVTLT